MLHLIRLHFPYYLDQCCNVIACPTDNRRLSTGLRRWPVLGGGLCVVALLMHIIYTLSLSNFSHVTDAVLKDSLNPAEYVLHTSANTKEGKTDVVHD